MPSFADIRQFVVGQAFETPALPKTSFRGKTVIVTGANSGLGLECAKHLVALDVTRLLLACRNAERGEEARKNILRSQADCKTVIEVVIIDMSDSKSVIAFAESIAARFDRVDALIANAGIDTLTFELVGGDESTLAVNVVGTMRLAIKMLPKLQETATQTGSPTHLSVVGSSIHAFAPDGQITSPTKGQIFATLNDEKKAEMSSRYFLSKLIVMLCTQELATRSSKGRYKDVVVNCVNPGWCKTKLFRVDDGGLGGRIGLRLLGRTAEEGSRTLVNAISGDRDTHGAYLSECRPKEMSAFVRSAAGHASREQLWVELMAKLDAADPVLSQTI
ncbi:hypothetical protein B0A48_06094 [Cryoendolithus antarcticus]|uniref:NAD(P)-binding protein n=1 Tax=Cryoendolithus antarcticus TaxID=1507870 RepID=A0A1V8TCV4_9PEZI|nr:hypothetical protein B0A48_06094 [Cryoendolithus antarcticus]